MGCESFSKLSIIKNWLWRTMLFSLQKRYCQIIVTWRKDQRVCSKICGNITEACQGVNIIFMASVMFIVWVTSLKCVNCCAFFSHLKCLLLFLILYFFLKEEPQNWISFKPSKLSSAFDRTLTLLNSFPLAINLQPWINPMS